jgi:3-methylcrotonyl-CoA carboxylase alpha subunit
MPGKIIGISVAVGDVVEAGAVLMLVEAMKMEHAIRAPKAGKIVAIAFAVGDLVDDGVDLLTLEAEEVPA